MITFDEKVLFAGLRNGPFPGKITKLQVDGIKIIIKAWQDSGSTSLPELAYDLATPAIETGWTYQPIKEYGGPKYYKKMYDIQGSRPKKARELGNLQPGDGVKFCGRGYVQTTGRANYRKITKLVKEIFGEDVDFEANPDLMLQAKYAAPALVVALQRGIYTGAKIGTYVNKTPPDFVGARKTVNGTDRAGEIATIAKAFLQDLTVAAR